MNFDKVYETGKAISCGLIIYDPKEHCILAGHPTKYKSGKGDWDILKGHLEPGEDPKEAAIREAYEESGIELTKEEIESMKDLGKFKYSKKKDLHLFLLEKEIPPLYTLECKSIVDGETYPEMDAYKKVPVKELYWLFPNLQRVIKQALNLI
jgi:8-oxo-dGTP pyrophosphatase MutT (NUDIX family)